MYGKLELTEAVMVTPPFISIWPPLQMSGAEMAPVWKFSGLLAPMLGRQLVSPTPTLYE